MTQIETIQEPTEADVETLVLEVERYLAVVDMFRSMGCGPEWAEDEAPPHGWLDRRTLEALRGLSLV